jgi:hypothetical protein
MKKYFLTIITSSLNTQRTRKISDAIFEMIDDNEIRYAYIGDTLFFTFKTDSERIDIFHYLETVLENELQGFVLTELNDNTSVSFPNDMLEYLFSNVDSDSTNDIEWFDDEQVEENIVRMLNNIKKITNKPSLDFILDKIKDKGINSLTPYEKDSLHEYSKN